MAFFDKLNQVAKSIGEKAGDAIETTKITAKIASEKKLRDDEFRKIGEYYYNIFISGGEVAEEVKAYCDEAKVHADAIVSLEEEMGQLQDDETEEPAAETAPEAPAQIVCPSCKKVNEAGTKFCSNCGMKL